jgi:hypothetical protein
MASSIPTRLNHRIALLWRAILFAFAVPAA